MKMDAIKHWIAEHEGDRFVVLDDDSLDVPNLVKTNPQIGLAPENSEKAIEILNSNE